LKGRREWVDDDPRETGCFFLRLMGWYQVEVAVYVVYLCICMYVHLMVCSGLCCAVLAMCVLGGEYGEREGRRDGRMDGCEHRGADGWTDSLYVNEPRRRDCIVYIPVPYDCSRR